MNLGIVGYNDYSGIGNMITEYKRNLDIKYHLAVPGRHGNNYSHESLTPATGYYKENKSEYWNVLEKWINNNKINLIIVIESPFSINKMARKLKVPTVLVVMWEWFNPSVATNLNEIDHFICPTLKAIKEVNFNHKTYIPNPINKNSLPHRQISGPAKSFIHNAGNLGNNFRKGTLETIEAFVKVKKDIKLTINSMKPINSLPVKYQLLINNDNRINYNFKLFNNIHDLYNTGDVLIYPSRFDGHNLVGQEAATSGLPVITTNAEPMNEYWLDDNRLLVNVKSTNKISLAPHSNSNCIINYPDIDDLANKIVWCSENDLSEISINNSKVGDKTDWTILKNEYHELFDGMK